MYSKRNKKKTTVPWNKGKLMGQKSPLTPQEIWAIRIRLQNEGRRRDLALFNLAIDSKLRASDLLKIQVSDIASGGRTQSRGMVSQQKTRRPVRFEITDTAVAVPVLYTGILPDLFREGQGVVTLGRLSDDGVFMADEVLAKHDETYMPPEVADALKKSGQWREPTAAESD